MTAPMTETANFSAGTGSGWYNTLLGVTGNRSPSRTAQVSGGSALTNFPMLYSVASDANLAAEAQATGNDILFTASDGVTKLNHQIESYNFSPPVNSSPGSQIPSLSNSADTVIYIYYGNAVAANQQNPAASGIATMPACGICPTGPRYPPTIRPRTATTARSVRLWPPPARSAAERVSTAPATASVSVPISNLAQTYTAEFWINSSFPHPYMTILGGTVRFQRHLFRR